nr:hypothetical protein [uncultured Kingella sp.]
MNETTIIWLFQGDGASGVSGCLWFWFTAPHASQQKPLSPARR